LAGDIVKNLDIAVRSVQMVHFDEDLAAAAGWVFVRHAFLCPVSSIV
jgi:hypothetical protein